MDNLLKLNDFYYHVLFSEILFDRVLNVRKLQKNNRLTFLFQLLPFFYPPYNILRNTLFLTCTPTGYFPFHWKYQITKSWWRLFSADPFLAEEKVFILTSLLSTWNVIFHEVRPFVNNKWRFNVSLLFDELSGVREIFTYLVFFMLW